MPWSNRESTIVPNSEKSRTLFMEAADSDKDSKSSELTIGPSCIQFRLIIVKVEKFQSAISGHPRVISPFPRLILPRRPIPPRKRECSLFFFRVLFPHSFLRVPDCRTILSRVYDFRLHCLYRKRRFSRSVSTIGKRSKKARSLLFLSGRKKYFYSFRLTKKYTRSFLMSCIVMTLIIVFYQRSWSYNIIKSIIRKIIAFFIKFIFNFNFSQFAAHARIS